METFLSKVQFVYSAVSLTPRKNTLKLTVDKQLFGILIFKIFFLQKCHANRLLGFSGV